MAPQHRQGPRFSIRMIIWIFCSDTETGAMTPLGRGAKTLTTFKILLLSLIADVKQSQPSCICVESMSVSIFRSSSLQPCQNDVQSPGEGYLELFNLGEVFLPHLYHICEG